MKGAMFMTEENPVRQASHNVILENREKMMISGVVDVISFDEQEIVMMTELGELTINGEGLNILNLSRETSELDVEGEISLLSYSRRTEQKNGLLSRLFR